MSHEINTQIIILGLHRVGHPPAASTHRNLFTSPRFLRFQVKLLTKLGFRFTTLKAAMERRTGKYAVLTFDDGYLDTMTDAAPILERMSVPATVFVVTGDVGKQGHIWEEAGEKLPANLMSWEMLRDLKGRGWEIGSHASQHVHLDRYPQGDQSRTIQESVDAIGEKVGERPASFCYPYGAYNDATKTALEDAGITYGLTCQLQTTHLQVTDSLEIKRLPAGGRKPHHYIKFAFRVLRAAGGLSAIGFGSDTVTPLAVVSRSRSLNQ